MRNKIAVVAPLLFCAALLLYTPLRTPAQDSQQSSKSNDASAASQNPVPPYKNPDLPVEQRVNDLVSRMTLEEEASQMGYVSPAIPRLGVSYYNWWSEGLHGFGRAGRATVFPQAIGAAATWDVELLRKTGEVVSTEGRAKYEEAVAANYVGSNRGLTIWSPNINIFRDPRWGRGQETYGEDPFLTAQLGTAFVEGIQGNDPHYLRSVSTPKHFAVHSGSELLRHITNVDVSPYDLEDTYLPAFRETVVEGKADSVMCAYSAVNGKPDCASDLLLEGHLREAWHFDGYVVSDCGAVDDIWANHHYAPDNVHAIALAIEAGTDLSCGGEYRDVPKAVKQGLLSKEDVDRAVKRLFTARFRLGMFDPPDRVPYAKIPLSAIDSSEHRTLALQSARESIVLLKNANKTLPLAASTKTIAVIGPEADLIVALEGNYNGTPSNPVTPLLGIERRFGKQGTIVYAQGSKLVNEIPVPIPATVLRPSRSDEKTLAIGGLTGEYYNNPNFEGVAMVRTDQSINFDWEGLNPNPGSQRRTFSVRWTGTFTPPAPGDYRIGVDIDGCYPCKVADNFAFYLDGKLIEHRPTTPDLMIPFHFADAHSHQIRLDYSHNGGDDAGITLLWDPPVDALRDEAVATAQKADAVIACVGITPELESEENQSMRLGTSVAGFYGGDRTDIALPQPQQELLRALHATGKPVIVVLMSGSAVAFDPDLADAILAAWYPGEEGGTAIGDTLAGDNNPSGRLPVTFYKSVADLPAFNDYSMRGRTYRYFTGQPLFSFGFGLSYANFTYSGLSLSSQQINMELYAGATLEVDASIQNTSGRDGEEVAELYLTFPKSDLAPIRALRGFKRVTVPAGQSRKVHFSLSPRDLSSVTASGERVVAAGEYTISVGGAQPGSGLSVVETHFTINGTQTLPK